MDADPSLVDPEAEKASLDVRVTGRVQGVGFRYFALEVARQFNLTGYVMNLRDGGVQAYAEGPRALLEGFLGAMQRGPDGAHVRGVRTSWGKATGQYLTFTIQPTP